MIMNRTMYENEQNNAIPPNYTVIPTPTPTNLSYFDGDSGTDAGGNTGMKVYWVERLAPYLDSTLERPFARQGKNGVGGLHALGNNWIFHCPDDPALLTGQDYYEWWFSYNANFFAGGDAGQLYSVKPVKTTMLKNGSSLIYCMDGPQATDILPSSGKYNSATNVRGFPSTSTAATDGYLISRRHGGNKSANALFCDCHAETLTAEVSDTSLNAWSTLGAGNDSLDRMLIPSPFIPQN